MSPQACKFGCLALGDCVRACKFGALRVVDGLATVNYRKCTGCGACAMTCPRGLIVMVPFRHDPMMTVACSSREDLTPTSRTMPPMPGRSLYNPFPYLHLARQPYGRYG